MSVLPFQILGDQYAQTWPRAKQHGVTREQFVQECLDDAADHGTTNGDLLRMELYLRGQLRRMESNDEGG